MEQRLADVERRVSVLEHERTSLIQKIDDNTKLTQTVAGNTQEIVDLFKTTKKVNNGFILLAKWVGVVSAGFAGVVAVYHILTGWFTK